MSNYLGSSTTTSSGMWAYNSTSISFSWRETKPKAITNWQERIENE